MKFDQQLDVLLSYLIENNGIAVDQIKEFSKQNGLNATSCVHKLKADRHLYYSDEGTKIKPTASGKLFYERGGYVAVTMYNHRVLDVAISTKRWTIIGIGIAIVIAIISWVISYNNSTPNHNNKSEKSISK